MRANAPVLWYGLALAAGAAAVVLLSAGRGDGEPDAPAAPAGARAAAAGARAVEGYADAKGENEAADMYDATGQSAPEGAPAAAEADASRSDAEFGAARGPPADLSAMPAYLRGLSPPQDPMLHAELVRYRQIEEVMLACRRNRAAAAVPPVSGRASG